MSETSTVEVRAATFYRVLGNLQTLSREVGEGSLLDTLCPGRKPLTYPQHIEELSEMILEMIWSGAHAHFPTTDTKVLGDMFLYIIRYIRERPELAAKISTMCGIHKVGTILFGQGDGYTCPLTSVRSNGRVDEIAELNRQLYELSKKLDDSTEVAVQAEFYTVENHVFHPESQFLRLVFTM